MQRSAKGMDNLRDQFTAGRLGMRAAFVRLSDLARMAGVDEDTITALHGQFFDGNVAVKAAFRVVLLLAETRPRKQANVFSRPASRRNCCGGCTAG